jgi:hypothetical protein
LGAVTQRLLDLADKRRLCHMDRADDGLGSLRSSARTGRNTTMSLSTKSKMREGGAARGPRGAPGITKGLIFSPPGTISATRERAKGGAQRAER